MKEKRFFEKWAIWKSKRKETFWESLAERPTNEVTPKQERKMWRLIEKEHRKGPRGGD